MIVTNDDQIEKNCRSLRVHGENPKYFHHTIGYNSRLDTLQAAMLLVKLPHLRPGRRNGVNTPASMTTPSPVCRIFGCR